MLFQVTPANAQHEHHQVAPDTGWAWSVDWSVFFTGNFQDRKFRDFRQIESQNWLMGMASRKLAGGTFGLHGMLSFEPVTLRELGSAQVFQTGETFGGSPLIDYQHPHDLLMGASASFERPVGRASIIVRGGLVDEPALGPDAFMHRPSASLHPTAPLSHHQLDSTHITHGVVTAGVRAGAWLLETSAFRGREPDEDRVALDLRALDSFAGRASWTHAGTRAQVSLAHVDEPQAAEPGDLVRLSASVEHSGLVLGRTAALMLAWGQNREQFSTENAWTAEAAVGMWRRGTGYLRGEIVDKHILEAGGLHPAGLQHPHIISTVSALTVGYQHEMWRGAGHTFSLGADATGHVVPSNLSEAYGRPRSFHVYGRWQVSRSPGAPPVSSPDP